MKTVRNNRCRSNAIYVALVLNSAMRTYCGLRRLPVPMRPGQPAQPFQTGGTGM